MRNLKNSLRTGVLVTTVAAGAMVASVTLARLQEMARITLRAAAIPWLLPADFIGRISRGAALPCG